MTKILVTLPYDKFQHEKDKWFSDGWRINKLPYEFPKRDKIELVKNSVAKVTIYSHAEVVCSNCGEKRTYSPYRYGEPCRSCGYKRTEMLRTPATGKFEVWYAKNPSFNEDDFPRSRTELGRDFVHLAEVWADSIGIVYHLMQGDTWSQDGYARPIIRDAGLRHTSMSVGDLVKDGNQWFIVAGAGFNKFELEDL